ncbi:hypothetical protein BJ165DRAFT_1533169 [Panaeolus papilionaceus]|nr:hypothetical protein BJ165DRAFT_1533169 [Panaeolus papilionaceus]
MDRRSLYEKIKYRYVQEPDGSHSHVGICPGCDAIYAAGTIEEHIRRTHEEREIFCKFEDCTFSCLIKNRMDDHIRKVHGNGVLKCNYEGCTYAAANKCSLSKHREFYHNHIPRKQMKAYHRMGPVDLEEERIVPLDTQYRPIPATRTPSPIRQASMSKPRSRVSNTTNRVEPGNDIGSSHGRGASSTTSAPRYISAPLSFARAGEISITTDRPTGRPRASDDWFFGSGNATASSSRSVSERRSSPTRRGRGRGRASMAASTPHILPELSTPANYQATFGLARKPRD